MPSDEKKDIYNSWFKKLKPQEKGLIILLMSAVFLSVYFSMFIKPSSENIAGLKKQEREANERAKLMLSQMPDLNKSKKELVIYMKKIDAMKEDVKNIEGRLLGPSQVPLLLTELIKCAHGLAIDFQTVKQNIESDKNGFSHLYIELKFDAKYDEMINYLSKIENISSFVKVEDLQVSQSKVDPRNIITATLKLSAILASVAQTQAEISQAGEQAKPEKGSTSRNPLTPSLSADQLKNKTLKIIGITYRGPGLSSSAIINNTVVKEGDTVEGYTAEKINSDSVVLNNGMETCTLTIER